MAGKSATPLTPKLRFPEFADGADWEARPLDKLAVRRTQRNFAGSKLRTLTNSAEFGVVDQRDYFEKDIATNTEKYFVVETGDFVYNPRISNIAPVGPISKNRLSNGVMSPLYSVFRFHKDEHDFFSHFFASTHWHQYLRIKSNSGARHDRMAISNDDLMAMPIPLPSTESEQQKIAECLGSLDHLIAAESRKLEALHQHKKGLMQQLFPQPGETVPRLRFSEFRDAEEWDEKAFSAFVELESGLHLAPDMYGTTGEVPYFSGPSDFTDELKNCRKWTTASQNLATSGDTLITVKGSGVGDIFLLHLPRVAMGRQLMAVRPKASDNKFVFYLLRSKKARFEALASGNLIPGLSRNDILGMLGRLPQKDEQRKIGTCLGALDSKISAQIAAIEALKQHKQGLLQQLFPSLMGEKR